MRTKQEELEILCRWRAEAREEPESRLAILMSDDLVQYFKNEPHPDVMAGWDRMLNQARELDKMWEELECASARERTFRQRLMTHDAGMDDLRTKLMLAQTEINCLKIKLWDAHGARLLAEYLK